MPVSGHAELRVCEQRLLEVLVEPVEEIGYEADLGDALVDGALVVSRQEAARWGQVHRSRHNAENA